MNGSPATGSIALGTRSVSGCSRVARPPASSARGGMSVIAGLHDRFRAFEVEPETDLLQARRRHGVAEPRLILRIEHQESAATGADQLAAGRTILHRVTVPLIDVWIGHAARAPLLVLPVLVHQAAEIDETSALQCFKAAQAEILHVIQILDHTGILLPRFVVLLLENRRRAARIA